MNGLVVQCYQQTSNKGVLEYSFNRGVPINERIENQTDVIGFSEPKVSYNNGALKCEWNNKPFTKVSYHENVYDFEQNNYYLQLASGPVGMFHFGHYIWSIIIIIIIIII